MAQILKFKPIERSTQHVCATCQFYQKDRMVPSLGACHAVGGHFAMGVWPKCQGALWQERKSFMMKLKELFWKYRL